MMFTLRNASINKTNTPKKPTLPKYASTLLNQANRFSQATRPSNVGQMSDLFQEFMASSEDKSISGWCEWYAEGHPDTIEKATQRLLSMIHGFRSVLNMIDEAMAYQWIEDLVITKTYEGLYVQTAILSSLAQQKGMNYRLATKQEEARGIDGYVGDTPYSIKPESYKLMDHLQDHIGVLMIYYSMDGDTLHVDVEE